MVETIYARNIHNIFFKNSYNRKLFNDTKEYFGIQKLDSSAKKLFTTYFVTENNVTDAEIGYILISMRNYLKFIKKKIQKQNDTTKGYVDMDTVEELSESYSIGKQSKKKEATITRTLIPLCITETKVLFHREMKRKLSQKEYEVFKYLMDSKSTDINVINKLTPYEYRVAKEKIKLLILETL